MNTPKAWLKVCCFVVGLVCLSLFAVFLPTGAAMADDPTNLLANGSFEDGVYSPTGHPDNWDTDAFRPSEATFLWDDIQAVSGAKSIKIDLATPNDARWIQTVTVEPYAYYRLSGWIKTENVVHTEGTVMAGANLSLFGTWTYVGGLYGTQDWTYVSLLVYTGSDTEITVGARLGYWSGTVTGAAWFDDLRLEFLTTDSLLNPDFEDGAAGQPEFWQTETIAGAATFTWDDATAYSGVHSVRIYAPEQGIARWVQVAPVDEDSEYELSGWIKTSNVQGASGAKLGVYGQDSSLAASTWDIYGTQDWVFRSIRFVTGHTTRVKVACTLGDDGIYGSDPTGSGTVWCDNLELTKIRALDRSHITTQPHMSLDIYTLIYDAFDDPETYLMHLDEVYVALADLVGGVPFGGAPITVCTDYSGYFGMLSGNPIRVNPSPTLYGSGSWPDFVNTHGIDFGVPHELGHDFDLVPQASYYIGHNYGFDDGEHWANFKALYAYDVLGALYPELTMQLGPDVGGQMVPLSEVGHQFVVYDALPWIASGRTDYQNTDAYTGLLYMLVEQIGWEPFKATFREYADLAGIYPVPGTDEEKIELLARMLSRHAGVDLIPQFRSWGFPIDGDLPPAGATIRVSIATDGTEANKASDQVSVSGDGRLVVFQSLASTLVAGDTNRDGDIFVHNVGSGVTERISIASDGTQGNRASDQPAISADGRYVAFRSRASNLATGDSNGVPDIFVRDLLLGRTERVSVRSNGAQANDTSFEPGISRDGRYVAFASRASNLVAGDRNNSADVFVRDRVTGETTRVSVTSGGGQGNEDSRAPVISADGRYVAFQSQATNLVAGDTNGDWDIFVHDGETGETTRVSVASDSSQGNRASQLPAISADGRYVAFRSANPNFVPGDSNFEWDIFVHDRETGETTRVSVADDGTQGNKTSDRPAISADGRYVTFESQSTNLTPDDTNGAWDVFIHDRLKHVTGRVSVASDNTQGNGASLWSAISADGEFVAFRSTASNLVPGDTNGVPDIFFHHRFIPFCDSVTQIPTDECEALQSLYDSTDGDSWGSPMNWLVTYTPCDDWRGVVCESGHVTALDLHYKALNGNIPSELGNLTDLVYLDLRDNNLTGSIPPELGNLVNLVYLELRYNSLTGSIPPELGNLVNLVYLNLGSNDLTGNIPTALGNLVSLENLQLYGNQLSGNIPPSLGNLTNLQGLGFSYNQLSGSIPPTLGNLINMQGLDLHFNQLTGEIPPELGNLTHLLGLYLHGNHLSGSIPPELGNLISLVELYLGEAETAPSNDLSGSIPPELGDLVNLQYLALYNNQLSGNIPPEMGNLAALLEFGLSGNELSGSIPPELSHLTAVRGLYIANNQLSGNIPSELGDLSVRYLDLSGNQLEGNVPGELVNLPLWYLNLSSNQLSSLSPALSNLTSVCGRRRELDVGYNLFHPEDVDLLGWLDGCDPDWLETQTIPPDDLQGVPVDNQSVQLTWTPIPYTGDGGSYEIGYATISGGPYTVHGATIDKFANGYLVDGLTPGTPYYFIVRTFTPAHNGQQNELLSDPTLEVQASTP